MRRALAGVVWGSAGALAWTHAGYPVAAAALARLRPRPVRKAPVEPTVVLVVPAHNEEAVIGRRIENALELDYPRDRLEIVVASDGSTDATDAIAADAARHGAVRLLRCPRRGKIAALNEAARATESEVLAFSDANAVWSRDALRKLVQNLADPDVGYVCGRVVLGEPDGTNCEGAYWRYELWVRESESRLGSITGGNGAIYAVRRSDFAEFDLGHDLGLPRHMVKCGRRAVYEPEALAFERPSSELEDEYERKVRMLARAWAQVLEGGMLREVDRLYLGQLVSHRLLRYASGLLHAVLLGASIVLAPSARRYRIVLAVQLFGLALAAAGRRRAPVPGGALAYYYILVTTATVTGLLRYLRSGVPFVWESAAGTRGPSSVLDTRQRETQDRT